MKLKVLLVGCIWAARCSVALLLCSSVVLILSVAMSYHILLCWSQIVLLPIVCGSQLMSTKSPGDDICLPWTSFNPTTVQYVHTKSSC